MKVVTTLDELINGGTDVIACHSLRHSILVFTHKDASEDAIIDALVENASVHADGVKAENFRDNLYGGWASSFEDAEHIRMTVVDLQGVLETKMHQMIKKLAVAEGKTPHEYTHASFLTQLEGKYLGDGPFAC
jgi:hypothetical protein